MPLNARTWDRQNRPQPKLASVRSTHNKAERTGCALVTCAEGQVGFTSEEKKLRARESSLSYAVFLPYSES